MKKFITVQLLLGFFLLITFTTTTFGASEFKQHYNKGIEFYKQGKYEQAGKEFQEAIQLKPNDVYAIYGLGNTHYCLAKYDDAVEVYKKAININPDYAKVHYSLSLAYSKLGKTHESEEQKKIFRKLSRGGKSSKSPVKHVSPSHSSKRKSIDHAPKKSLSHAPKKTLATPRKSLPPSKKKSIPGREAVGTHSTHTKSATTHSAHEQSKHDIEHKKTKHQEKNVYERHKTAATSRRNAGDDSHSIFKGYSGKKQKADKRVFTKAKHNYKIFGTLKNPFGNSVYFIQNKWHESILNKIWICAAGYIFAAQIWLCIISFLCIIIWRIREKV